MTVEQVGSNQNDEFPIGMRVLAVDDDPTCLFYLGTLLRRCQYHVTTTNQAAMALKMLRENKNRFDLVISDVVMPNMDGFQLLEIVGLEMDLPVIMLSGNGDTKLVRKGIDHGACDYLLKPVRLEELKNIWQHVIRRRKMNVSDNQDKHRYENRDGRGMGNSDQNAKLIKRRKDEDEDDDRDENTNDDDNDSSKPKKPRVVWSVELHRKFIAAVDQLGIDKAVPKKILDLMDVEKLTRENVASHLQKFRLYLKRISCGENQHANTAAAFAGANPSFLPSASLDGLGNFHNLVGQPQFTTNQAFGSYPPAGVFDRLNNPAGLDICGIPSTRMIQLGQEQNSSGFGSGHVKFQPGVISGNDNESILLGMPTSLEFDKVQRNKTPISGVFPDARKTIGHNYILPSACEEQFQDEKVNGNQHSVTVASLNSGYSPNLYNDSWLNATQSSGIQPNSYPLRDNGSEITLPIGNNDSSNCENLIYGMNGTFNEAGRTLGLSLDSNNSFYHRSAGFNAIEHSNLLAIKDNEIDFAAKETPLNQKYNYALNQERMQGGFILNNVGCLEDLVSAVVKQERGKGKNVERL